MTVCDAPRTSSILLLHGTQAIGEVVALMARFPSIALPPGLDVGTVGYEIYDPGLSVVFVLLGCGRSLPPVLFPLLYFASARSWVGWHSTTSVLQKLPSSYY